MNYKRDGAVEVLTLMDITKYGALTRITRASIDKNGFSVFCNGSGELFKKYASQKGVKTRDRKRI